MADPFDSSTLFAEFNRPREASDRILMSKLKGGGSPRGKGRSENGIQSGNASGNAQTAQFSVGADAAEHDAGEASSSSGESESESENETTEDTADGPVEIGRDSAGCVMYRPGEKERRLGQRLLQNADYGDDQQKQQQTTADVGDKDDYVKRMKEIHTMYKKQTRLIDPTRHIPPTENQEGPSVQVLYMNDDFARKYRADIEHFIMDLMWRDAKEKIKPARLRGYMEIDKEDFTVKSLTLSRHMFSTEMPHHVCLAEGSVEVKDHEASFHEHRTSTVIGCSRFYNDFQLDPMGFPLVDYIPALSYGWEIPRYEQQFKKALPVDSDSDEDDDGRPSKPERMKSCCFNCGGSHRLNECQEQRDFQRINENRRKFMDQAGGMVKQGSLTKGSGRCIEDDPRFSAFKPGVYSDALKQALGLHPSQLPPFVYKMRELGYPPGYLIEAEIEKSGISMFDKDGRALRSDRQENVDEGNLEDGEMDDELEDDKIFYDVDKLVDFPGFNVPLPEGVVDEAQMYGFPPMMPMQSKEFMKTSLPTPRGTKRQSRVGVEEGVDSPKRRRLEEDMDLETSEAETTDSDQPRAAHEAGATPPSMWWHLYSAYTQSPHNAFIMAPPPPPAEEEYAPLPPEAQLLPPPLPPELPPQTPPPPPPPPPPDSPPCITTSPPPLPGSGPADDPGAPPVPSPCSSPGSFLGFPSESVSPSDNQAPPSPCSSMEFSPTALPDSPSDHKAGFTDIESCDPSTRPPNSPLECPMSDGGEAYEGATLRLIPLDRHLPGMTEVDDGPPLSRSSSCASNLVSRSDAGTPTLEDLEAQRRLLEEQLGDDDSQSSTGTHGGQASSQRSSRASSVDNDNYKFTVPEPPGTPGQNPPLPGFPPPQTPPNPPLPPGTPPVTPVTTPQGPPPLPGAPPPETPPRPPLPVGTPPVTPVQAHLTTPTSTSTPGADSAFTTPTQNPDLSLNRSNSASIERALSTPVRKVCTEDLPDPVKFRQGVQDHIPYENLPDATGRYEKMKDVIANIRRLKKKSQ